MDSTPQDKMHLVVRADASASMGIGHVMRSLALAHAWQDAGGQVTFVTARRVPALESRLRAEQMEVVSLSAKPGSRDDARQTREAARMRNTSWVVVDGYQFDAAYQELLKTSEAPLLCIDDLGDAPRYVADAILNQNGYADPTLYDGRAPLAQLLLGSRYVLLRREFLRWREWKREIPEQATRVLVTLGGGDPENVAGKVLTALAPLGTTELEVRVILGSTTPHASPLESYAKHLPMRVRVERDVRDLAELMAWADVAISAGGSTCYEMAFMGLPVVILVLAENQRAVAQHVQQAGVADNLGRAPEVSGEQITGALTALSGDSTRRRHMSEQGRRTIDGLGAERVVHCMLNSTIRLRKVTADDGALLWALANDPAVRAGSFSSTPIPWEEHAAWLRSRLADPDCHHVLIVLNHGEVRPIGQVRFDVAGRQAEINVSLVAEFRGRGYGSVAIRMACRELFGLCGVEQIRAHAKEDNHPSMRAFINAGFRSSGLELVKGRQALVFLLNRAALASSAAATE